VLGTITNANHYNRCVMPSNPEDPLKGPSGIMLNSVENSPETESKFQRRTFTNQLHMTNVQSVRITKVVHELELFAKFISRDVTYIRKLQS